MGGTRTASRIAWALLAITAAIEIDSAAGAGTTVRGRIPAAPTDEVAR